MTTPGLHLTGDAADRLRRPLMRNVRRIKMPSQRALQSVAHNLGHHAVSGLSYLVPHVFRAAKHSGQLTVSIDVLADQSLPPTLSIDEPLRLSVGALRERFNEIVSLEGFTRDAIRAATVAFRFEDRWPATPATLLAKARAGFHETPEAPRVPLRGGRDRGKWARLPPGLSKLALSAADRA